MTCTPKMTDAERFAIRLVTMSWRLPPEVRQELMDAVAGRSRRYEPGREPEQHEDTEGLLMTCTSKMT